MSGTLYAMGMLDTGAGFMMAGLIGILFGLFLEQAGFGSSRKLTAVFYFKDMAVVKVMITAVAVALVGYCYVVALGWLSPVGVHRLDTFWLAQIIGGLIFGIGFVVGGWCPGTAIVGLASAKLDALVFLVGVLLGSILFNEVFPLVRPIYEGASAGPITLYDTLGIPRETFIFAFCLMAVAVFAGSTQIEKRAGTLPPARPGRLARNGAAALILLLFAGGLFVVPQSGTPMVGGVIPAREGYLSQAAWAEAQVNPKALSDLIMRGDGQLLLVDLRGPEAYAAFHLRGAVSLPIETLRERADAMLPREAPIVLYADETAQAAQAWLQLREWGWSDVKVLRDGLPGFWRECLTPPSLADTTDEKAAKAQSEAFQARRDFFLEKREAR